MVGYICYHGKEPWGNVNRGWVESICRLAHVISSVLIKDRTVVDAFVEIERSLSLSWPNNSFRL